MERCHECQFEGEFARHIVSLSKPISCAFEHFLKMFNSLGDFPCHSSRGSSHGRRQITQLQYRQHCFDCWQDGQHGPGQLRRQQGRRRGFHQERIERACQVCHHVVNCSQNMHGSGDHLKNTTLTSCHFIISGTTLE